MAHVYWLTIQLAQTLMQGWPALKQQRQDITNPPVTLTCSIQTALISRPHVFIHT